VQRHNSKRGNQDLRTKTERGAAENGGMLGDIRIQPVKDKVDPQLQCAEQKLKQIQPELISPETRSSFSSAIFCPR
jgi:hypothetical protein